jgi:hypothetical protein
MKNTYWISLFALQVILILSTGCSTVGSRVRAINAAAAPVAADLNASVITAVSAARTAALGRIGALAAGAAVATANDINQRLDAYEKLQTEKNDLDAKFSVVFDENQHRSLRIANTKTAIGITGIAAGIGAAALIVASPANAVWVSIFSGYAGGVAGMNSVFDSNGYSREQIAALETTVAQQYASASADIRLVTLYTLASSPTTTGDQWLKELETQEAAMTKLRALAMTLNIPTGPIQKPQ